VWRYDYLFCRRALGNDVGASLWTVDNDEVEEAQTPLVRDVALAGHDWVRVMGDQNESTSKPSECLDGPPICNRPMQEVHDDDVGLRCEAKTAKVADRVSDRTEDSRLRSVNREAE